MAVTRTDNFARLNELLNHPDIYPWVGGELAAPLDASPLSARSILIEAEHGVFWFVRQTPGVWEAHTVFPPGAPGTAARAEEAIAIIQALPGYRKIVTQRPRNNPRATRFLEKLKFTYTHTEGMYQGLPLDHYERV